MAPFSLFECFFGTLCPKRKWPKLLSNDFRFRQLPPLNILQRAICSNRGYAKGATTYKGSSVIQLSGGVSITTKVQLLIAKPRPWGIVARDGQFVLLAFHFWQSLPAVDRLMWLAAAFGRSLVYLDLVYRATLMLIIFVELEMACNEYGLTYVSWGHYYRPVWLVVFFFQLISNAWRRWFKFLDKISFWTSLIQKWTKRYPPRLGV